MKLKPLGSALALTLATAPLAHAQDAYLGEIRQFGFNFCPAGWTLTNGSALSIAQNTALFSLLGTTYGGDGRTTFALPNRSAVPAAAAPAPAPAMGGEARVFQDCAMGGWNLPLGLGDHRPADLRAPYTDNNVSAVRASPGWQVTLFDGPNFDGQSITVTGEDSCLVTRNFNDRTSSIRVTRTTAPPVAPVAAQPGGVMCIATTGIFPPRN